MLSMLSDHAGRVFFPDQIQWHLFGRLAFPLYAYCIVMGYGHTKNLKNYMIRLVLIGLVSQLPYWYALKLAGINVVGTLFVSLCVLVLLDRAKNMPLRIILVAAAAYMLEWGHFDYGMYGLFLVLICRYTRNGVMAGLHLVLNLAFLILKGWFTGLFSIFSTLAIAYAPCLFGYLDRIRIPRWLWRSFYPLHLTVLALARLWV
jgi:hypothetical protein